MPKSASTLLVSMINGRFITGYLLLILIIGEKSRSISSMLMPNAPVVPKIIYNDNTTYYPRIVPSLAVLTLQYFGQYRKDRTFEVNK